jgi:serine kinase of HPr protein (carbohydrate metabolism regulator)
MTVEELARELNLETLTGRTNLERNVRSGYTSDLLSDVIANIDEDAVWITIQRHVNILGVAKLKDVPAIVVPHGLQVAPEVIDKAREQEIALLRGTQSAFELSGLVYNVLNRNRRV